MVAKMARGRGPSSFFFSRFVCHGKRTNFFEDFCNALLGNFLVDVFFFIYEYTCQGHLPTSMLQHKVGKNLWHNPEWNFTSPLPSFRILTYSDHNSADRGTSVVQAMNNPHLISHSVQDMTRHGMFQGSIMACAETTMPSRPSEKIPVDPPTIPVDLSLGGNHVSNHRSNRWDCQSLTGQLESGTIQGLVLQTNIKIPVPANWRLDLPTGTQGRNQVWSSSKHWLLGKQPWVDTQSITNLCYIYLYENHKNQPFM